MLFLGLPDLALAISEVFNAIYLFIQFDIRCLECNLFNEPNSCTLKGNVKKWNY